MKLEALTPLYRELLGTLAIGANTQLVRAKGGYRRKDGGGPVFTTRTVNAMERAYLVQLDDNAFPPTVTLTSQGRRLAEQLLSGGDVATAVVA